MIEASPEPKSAKREAKAMTSTDIQPAHGVEAIRQVLAHTPDNPGCYLMKDAAGQVIYVGKAKRLKARLGSYTRPPASHTYYTNKVEAMKAKVAAVEFVVTASDKEAVLLEHTLIKRHRPRYNVELRDDKSYPYFRLALADDFPRLSLVRRPNPADGARYFGPFDSAGAAKQTLRMLQRIFPLRRCADAALKNRVRPCLDFETGRCLGPCVGAIDREGYQQLARQVLEFFGGGGRRLAAEMEARMLAAAAEERFEDAARLRDRLRALQSTLERQQVSLTDGSQLDAVALHDAEGALRLAVLKVRLGRVEDSRVFEFESEALSPAEVMGQALLSLYAAAPPPPLILLSHLPEEPELLAEVLAERAGRSVELRRPRRGDKRGLLELAMINAGQPRAAQDDDSGPALATLARKLNLAGPPRRMECVDISHLGGRLTVASVAAFEDGRPRKAGYRRYKLLGQEGAPDDYASMAQALERRLSGDDPPPDLLIVDGGKGQLAVAVDVLTRLRPAQAPALAAIAKGQAPGEPDRLFAPGRKNPLNLAARDRALLLVMRLRDEAHRFAVEYHKLLRSKALKRSILDEIPGVGPGRKKKLLTAFGSLAALKRASAREMVEQAGLDRPTAGRVEAFLAALDTLEGPQ